MRAVFRFIAERGFSVMLCGIAIIIAGIAAYITVHRPRFAGTPYPAASVVLVFIGAAVYAIGRVSVFFQRRRYERPSRAAAADDDEL